MCDCSPHLFLSHALGLGLGIMFIAELARRGTATPHFWIAVGLSSAAMCAAVFHVTRGHYFFDFTKAYWAGGNAALQGPGEVVKLYQQGAENFVNIPILAYAFAPFALIPPLPSALIFSALGLAALAVGWKQLGNAARLDTEGRGVLLFLFAAFGPLIYSIREGNTSHIVLVLVVWAFVLLRERREILAGAVLAIAALIKLPLLLFGVYYVLRARWNVVFGGAAVICATLLLSLLVFGWSAHVTWYELSVRPYARDPIPALNVQSIAAALARLELGPGSIYDWSPHQLSPALHYAARASTFLLLAVTAAAALAPRGASARRVSKDVAHETEFLIVLMLACIASPLSWSHYYAWMLMPIAFFLAPSEHFIRSPSARLLAWVAIVLAAGPMTILTLSGAILSELSTRVLSSTLLFGGLIFLGLLAWSRWQMEPVEGSDAHTA